MKIDNLQELKKLIKLCRETGVDIIKVDGIELVLGASPAPATKIKKSEVTTATYAPGGITADTQIITDELTPEQLLFYSSVPTDAPSEEERQ